MDSNSVPPTPSIHPIPENVVASSPSLWSRISTYASENKVAVFTIGAIVIVAGAGGVYYISQSRANGSSTPKEKKGKKDKRKKEKEQKEDTAEKTKPTVDVVSDESDALPNVDEASVQLLNPQQRKDYAARLKAAGNKAYNAKDYPTAIDLYSKAILCKQDAVYFSNRSACYNALQDWDKVVEDTTAAIALDPEYVKALNRRANAYEQSGKYSEALLDYTASCIIDGFRNEQSAQSVERLLKAVAEAKAKVMLASKPKRLPSATFVSNYLQSFRPQPTPAGLEDTAELEEGTGDYYLRAGLQAVSRKTAESYNEAEEAFNKAVELGSSHEAIALNWRGTFKYLRGDSADALADLSRSIELDPKLTQSYAKRATMRLEISTNPSERDAAAEDFAAALQQNPDDPDIYYHRAQLHFICNEYAEAARDYQKSIDLDREFIFSHIQLGVTQYKMGSIASSMATFRRCMKNFDNVPDVYNYYGELLLDQQNFSEAIENFDKAVEMERKMKPMGMNVLPLINRALALFQWKQDFAEAEKLCGRALILDPDCDIAVATMAQLLLQQGRVPEALTYFEKAADLARTEAEIVNALSYAEATRTQLEVQEKYPQLAHKLSGMATLGGR